MKALVDDPFETHVLNELVDDFPLQLTLEVVDLLLLHFAVGDFGLALFIEHRARVSRVVRCALLLVGLILHCLSCCLSEVFVENKLGHGEIVRGLDLCHVVDDPHVSVILVKTVLTWCCALFLNFHFTGLHKTSCLELECGLLDLLLLRGCGTIFRLTLLPGG